MIILQTMICFQRYYGALFNSSFSSRMEELEPLVFRSGYYATWMITDLCKMTSIQMFFRWMNHKDEELSIVNIQEELS